MTTRTVSLEDQEPTKNYATAHLLAEVHQCQHTMHGSKGWRKRGYLNVQVGKWSRSCTNRATGKVGRKWVCSSHGGPK